MIALTAAGAPTLGNIWRISAKKSDFYLDARGHTGFGGVGHLSVHGPKTGFDGHRFHMKVDRRAVVTERDCGYFVEHSIPKRGYSFAGHRVAPDAYLVARIRWTWHLQRPRFRAAAAGAVPDLVKNQSGAILSEQLEPNEAWDIDLVVSYNEPFWPDPTGSLRDNARLAPLRNNAGLWLTATSYHRSQTKYPAPRPATPPLPKVGERPNRISCGGPGDNRTEDMYWFVETITALEVIEATAAARGRPPHPT